VEWLKVQALSSRPSTGKRERDRERQILPLITRELNKSWGRL
jgi:hypothetical protein